MRKLRKLLCAFLMISIILGVLPGTEDLSVQVVQAKTKSTQRAVKKKKFTGRISENELDLIVGDSSTVSLSGISKTAKVKWFSENTRIATVKGSGRSAKITAMDTGNTVIRAKIGKKILSCGVFVYEQAETAQELFEESEETESLSAGAWENGKWENDSYYNGSGKLIGSFSHLMEMGLPKLKFNKKSANYLYIGASRVTNADDAVKDPHTILYSCGGARIRWFFLPAWRFGIKRYPIILVIRAFLKMKPSGTVIIDMGGNDLSNVQAYIGLYRTLIRTFPRAKFYFMGVLPRAKEDPSNEERRNFNITLSEALPGHVIDLFDEVWNMPNFRTKDGIHYYKKQVRKVYKMMFAKIGRNITVESKKGTVKEKKIIAAIKSTTKKGIFD